MYIDLSLFKQILWQIFWTHINPYLTMYKLYLLMLFFKDPLLKVHFFRFIYFYIFISILINVFIDK